MIDGDSGMDRPVVVGLGEVLFDCFPDRTVLGGAPVNVVVHASQLLDCSGGYGVVVSRVGNDDLGHKLTEELDRRGVVTNLIQLDPQLPTGTVQVRVSESGEPTYEITEGVAWDSIGFTESLELLASQCSAVCFGTLAQRSDPSRTTIRRFLHAATDAVRLFDVNLRQHFYNRDILADSLAAATVMKLNEGELDRIGELLGDDQANGVDAKVYRLADTYQLECIALTRGSRGTVLYYDGRRYESAPIAIRRTNGADNVGAGDACAAGLVYGLLMKWQPEHILELANRMGAFVASQPGATPSLSEEIMEFVSTVSA